jgi:hypothetical protein
VTAAASRPPATPPIGALTMGTRRPKLVDQGVDNIALFGHRWDRLQHGQHDHRILDRVQRVTFRRNSDVVAGLAVPRVAAGGEAYVTLQHLQRGPTRTVMLGQVVTGKQGQPLA